ncbi:Zinc finger C2H2-type [Cinara cedri]|uniref:Zinc finger C2H2-type n=1 Tax=Cinara cedri TaxID=506608 RepID=A0A5E4MGV0_9HEMI|nr:Zinc finger C2H2-type [Cinara cedri]
MSKNCVSTALTLSDLRKEHVQIVKEPFYCPVSSCKYNANYSPLPKSFKNLKLLRQHCIKVHLDKKHKCEKCDKGFPTESILKSHIVTCGVKYSCYCGIQYKSPEAFLTHTKRKQHNIGLKYTTIMKFLKSRKLVSNLEDLPDLTGLEELESSKKSAETQTITDIQTSSDSSTQTTFENKDCMLRHNDPKLSSATSSPIKRLCAQTQTDPMGGSINVENETDPLFLDSETQTNFDFLDIYTQTAESERLFGDLEFTNIQTQTHCSSLFNDSSINVHSTDDSIDNNPDIEADIYSSLFNVDSINENRSDD